MPDEVPLHNVNDVRLLQGVVEIRDGGRLLCTPDTVVLAHLCEMAFENGAGHCPHGAAELVPGKILGCAKIRVEKTGSRQLTNIEERTLETFLQRLK